MKKKKHPKNFLQKHNEKAIQKTSLSFTENFPKIFSFQMLRKKVKSEKRKVSDFELNYSSREVFT